jgi:hypothetical protein
MHKAPWIIEMANPFHLHPQLIPSLWIEAGGTDRHKPLLLIHEESFYPVWEGHRCRYRGDDHPVWIADILHGVYGIPLVME